MPLLRRSLILALAGFALVPTVAFAAPAAKTPVPPDKGTWTVYDSENGLRSDLDGSMKIAAGHKYVSGFHGKLGVGADTACGTGTIYVQGKLKIIDAKGQGEYGAYNEWAVGKNRPSDDPVIQPLPVTIKRAGKTIHGSIYMTFVSAKGPGKDGNSGGTLYWAHGNCDLGFELKKK